MKFILILLFLFSSQSYAAVAFLSHSSVTGLNRVCVYTYAGTLYYRNVPTSRMCPIRIDV